MLLFVIQVTVEVMIPKENLPLKIFIWVKHTGIYFCYFLFKWYYILVWLDDYKKTETLVSYFVVLHFVQKQILEEPSLFCFKSKIWS